MALTSELMGLGMPGPLASRLGGNVAAVNGAGTAQDTATGIPLGQHFNAITAASSQTGVRLPAGASIGTPYWFFNVTGTSVTAVIFPNTGATINGGTATTGGVNLAQNKGIVLMQVATNQWVSVTGA